MRIKTDIPINTDLISKSKGVISINSDITVSAICTDSRRAEENDLYIPLKGERFDGEDFLSEAQARGAYTVSARDNSASVYVRNVREFMLSLAGKYKELISPRTTVAVTGSVGKTTTKDLCAAILSRSFKVHSTKDNLNNDIGVSYTLFSMPKDTDILIVEAGMNHGGELSAISEALQPNVAAITNIGTSHIGNFGSRDAIAEAKLEILNSASMPTAIIPYEESLLSKVRGRTVSICSDSSSYFLRYADSENHASFLKDGSLISEFEIKPKGTHIPKCLAFALAIAVEVGADIGHLREAVESVLDVPRATHISRIKNFRIIDDSYNASYESIVAALKTLTAEKGRHAAVIGDVLELGGKADDIHFSIGKSCAESDISLLFTFGEYAKKIAEGATAAGFKNENVYVNSDPRNPYETARMIVSHCLCDDIILFKASHRTGMHRIIKAIEEIVEEI